MLGTELARTQVTSSVVTLSSCENTMSTAASVLPLNCKVCVHWGGGGQEGV